VIVIYTRLLIYTSLKSFKLRLKTNFNEIIEFIINIKTNILILTVKFKDNSHHT